MSVQASVQSDLKLMGAVAEASALAATALALARELDKPKNSATSKSMCAKALVDVLRELRASAPVRVEADGVTDLNERRERRRAGVAGSADPGGS